MHLELPAHAYVQLRSCMTVEDLCRFEAVTITEEHDGNEDSFQRKTPRQRQRRSTPDPLLAPHEHEAVRPLASA